MHNYKYCVLIKVTWVMAQYPDIIKDVFRAIDLTKNAVLQCNWNKTSRIKLMTISLNKNDILF